MIPGKKAYALLAVCLLQVGVLATEYLGAVAPHWSGNTVKLKTVPVDPRSLFRGNYVRLKYAISTLPGRLYRGERVLRENERVYVLLERDDQGVSTASRVVLRQPREGRFIRGRIKRRHSGTDELTLKYGIEAYFAPRHEAKSLERRLRAGTIAEVSLADNGRAALQSLITD